MSQGPLRTCLFLLFPPSFPSLEHLLCADPVLGTSNTAVNTADKCPFPHADHILNGGSSRYIQAAICLMKERKAAEVLGSAGVKVLLFRKDLF